MTVATAIFLVLLLASSSYAAGRLHGQLSYKIGYRAGYRNGYADGDRAAWLYRRREPGDSSGAFATTAAGSAAVTGPTAAVPALTPTPALTPVGTSPDLPTVAESPPAPGPLLTPEVQRLLTEPPPEAEPEPVGAVVPHRGRAERPVNALPIPSITPPLNRGVVRQGTTYHAIGVGAAAGGGRHAHPD